jgi:hypothetical protein
MARSVARVTGRVNARRIAGCTRPVNREIADIVFY